MNMKKTFLFLAMSLLIFGCEKTPDLPEYKINEKLSCKRIARVRKSKII